jgi:hypothetical protein
MLTPHWSRIGDAHSALEHWRLFTKRASSEMKCTIYF